MNIWVLCDCYRHTPLNPVRRGVLLGKSVTRTPGDPAFSRDRRRGVCPRWRNISRGVIAELAQSAWWQWLVLNILFLFKRLIFITTWYTWWDVPPHMCHCTYSCLCSYIKCGTLPPSNFSSFCSIKHFKTIQYPQNISSSILSSNVGPQRKPPFRENFPYEAI